GLRLAVFEQVTEKLLQCERAFPDESGRLLLAFIHRLLLEQLNPAEYGIERRVKLVADQRHELVLGATCGFSLIAALDDAVAGLHQQRDVHRHAEDFGDTAIRSPLDGPVAAEQPDDAAGSRRRL